MNTFLMWIGGLLIAVLAALFAVPHFVDWNGYRGVFEEEVTRLIGRDVRVGGDVNVRFLPSPYVRFEKLRIADTSGISGAPLFAAESFTMWLAVPPLLKGIIEAKRIELDQPAVTLAATRDGRGNWSTLSVDRGSLPFVPADVGLDTVEIRGGTIAYHIEGSGELARVEKVEGELTARSLSGPYTFRGTADWKGSPRELRLVTNEGDAATGIRGSLQIRSRNDRQAYVLEGLLRDLWGQPSFTGTLSAKMRMAPAGGGEGRLEDHPFADIRAQIAAEPQAARLEEILISFENLGQPQIVTGRMTAAWGRQSRVDLELASRWLDLDLIAGAVQESSGQQPDAGAGAAASPGEDGAASRRKAPLPIASRLVAGLASLFPDGADVQAGLGVDQVNLGGEAVGALKISMARAQGPLELKTLRAVLPGGARLEFSGLLEQAGEQPTFAGDVYVGGASAARLIAWGLGSLTADRQVSDGPFAVSGAMRLGVGQLELTNATAEFSGVPVRGSVSWTDGPERALALTLEGHRIDTGWVGLGGFEVPTLADIVGGGGRRAVNSAESAGSGLADWLGGVGELRLKVQAGKLSDGEHELSDVDAELALKGGLMDVTRARFTTREGLFMEIDGRVEEVEAAARGELRFVVGAEETRAARALAELLGGEASREHMKERLAAMAPLRWAGRLAVGRGEMQATDLGFRGTMRGGTVNARLKLSQGMANWRDHPADISVDVTGGEAAQVMAAWLVGSDRPRIGASADPDGSGLVKAAGIPNEGMVTLAQLDSEGLSLEFNGRSGFERDSLTALSGEILLEARELRSLLMLTGIGLPSGARDLPIAGRIDIDRKPEAFAMLLRDISLGGAQLGGRLEVTHTGTDVPRIDGDLTADAGRLSRLLAAISAERAGALPELGADEAVSAAAEVPKPVPAQSRREAGVREVAQPEQTATPAAQVAERTSPFPDQPFDLSLLDRLAGRLGVKLGRLEVAEGIAVDEAKLEVTLAAPSIDMKIVSGQALGGSLAGNLSLERAPAGVLAAGSLAMSGARLQALTASAPAAGTPPAAAGEATLSISYSGRALSPRALIPVLTGSGEIRVQDAVIRGMTPKGVAEAADAVLNGETDGIAGELEGLLRQGIGRGELPVGSRKLPVKITDGAMRIEPLVVDTPEGQTTAVTTIDIATLAVDSAWQIVAKAEKERRPTWPGVSVIFVGGLGEVAALEPQIGVGALERELTVRRMERNVEELERLRRLDEEAAARERERQRQLEEEARAAAQAAAAAAGAASAAAVPPGGAGAGGASSAADPAAAVGTPPGGWETRSQPRAPRPPPRPRPPRHESQQKQPWGF